MANENTIEKLIRQFDSYGYYLDRKLDADIEENRKGQFALCFTDENGDPAEGVRVKVRQISHEFKFGCTAFYLNQFGDYRDDIYKNAFRTVFNYTVAPLYWDTLEPRRGKPRFSADSEFVSRRPQLDTIRDFCLENGLRVKGHCLIYNAYQPDWIPESNRELKIEIDKRLKAISERYGNLFEDVDVINEMLTIYKNCYRGNGTRNLQITDEEDHEKWCFDICKKYFPHSRLFWNEGTHETFGSDYKGNRSFYYLMLEKMLSQGVPVEGIGMQSHEFSGKEDAFETLKQVCNPLRLLDVFDCYARFRLPVHISEVTIPSFTNTEDDEQLQAELLKRLYKLWFGRKYSRAVVYWNMADGTAYNGENAYHAGLLRADGSEKPAFRALDELVNREWHTELESAVDGRLNFRGFYGDYEITATRGDKTVTDRITLNRDNTGYDNRLCDFRAKTVIIR